MTPANPGLTISYRMLNLMGLLALGPMEKANKTERERKRERGRGDGGDQGKTSDS